MSLKRQIQTGPNFTPAYQSSGTPFVTGSTGSQSLKGTAQKIEFPYVTRFFQIDCYGPGPLYYAFSENGITDNPGTADNRMYLTGSSPRLEVRCKEMWFVKAGGPNTDFTLIAGLTGISENQFPSLTGSEGYKGIG